jgi:hypothetical protein
MNPIDPNALPPEDGAPKPWHKPQPPSTDGGGADAGSAAGNIIDGAAEVAGGALEAVGGAVDIAGGCLDGCSGCSLAILVTLFAVAGTATAFFR